MSEDKKSKKQVEKFMKEGQMDTARIHAENAIRQYSEFTQYLQLVGISALSKCFINVCIGCKNRCRGSAGQNCHYHGANEQEYA